MRFSLHYQQLATPLLRQLVLRQLRYLQQGYLRIVEEDATWKFGDPHSSMCAEIVVLEQKLWQMALSNRTVGAGEAYTYGYWESPDLHGGDSHFGAQYGYVGWFRARLGFIRSADAQGHTLAKPAIAVPDRKNIAAHYDLGNTLFEHFLDPSMMYSSAIFPSEHTTLEEAQYYKLERICQKLDLQPSDHLLEIGTGWGSMALYAAQQYVLAT